MPKKNQYKKPKRKYLKFPQRIERPIPNSLTNGSTSYTSQAWTQSFELVQGSVSGNAFYVVIDPLGDYKFTAGGNTFYASSCQADFQTKFQAAYSEKTVVGVQVSLHFAGYNAVVQPVSWIMAYNDISYLAYSTYVGNPYLLQSYQGAQSGSIPPTRSVSKYFDMEAAKKKLGIGWSEVANWNYYDQLTVLKRPYIMVSVNTVSSLSAGTLSGVRLSLTYYTRYKAKY